MLLEQQHPGVGGRATVLTRNPTFSRLLQAILAEWHFSTEANAASPGDVLLLEYGLAVPDGAARVVWLSPGPLGEEPHLEVPISISGLYHYLERLFFPLPRHHIRLAVNQMIDLNVRGVWLVGKMLSISDRGARVTCPALLPRKEPLQLDVKLGGCPLRLTAEVIYDIPAGDSPGREHPQAGLLFKNIKPPLRSALRHFIERSLIERVCAQNGVAAGDPILSWFDLVKDPWKELSG